MVEIDNETLCILAVVFMVIIILMYMSRSNKEYTTPCGMKIASRYGTGSNPISQNQNLNEIPFGSTPAELGKGNALTTIGRPSGYAMEVKSDAGIVGKGLGGAGNMSFINIPGNVDAGQSQIRRPNAAFINPSDVYNPVYVPAFGISKGINEISGKEFNTPVPPSPFSFKIAPSTTLSKY